MRTGDVARVVGRLGREPRPHGLRREAPRRDEGLVLGGAHARATGFDWRPPSCLLHDLGPVGNAAEPALVTALADTTDFVAAAAAEALGLSSASAAEVEAQNKSTAWTLRFRATEALARLKH